MELPSEVLIHNAVMGMKGTAGTLIQIHPYGVYEANCRFGGQTHRLMLPVAQTVLIARDPEPPTVEGLEIERYGEE